MPPSRFSECEEFSNFENFYNELSSAGKAIDIDQEF